MPINLGLVGFLLLGFVVDLWGQVEVVGSYILPAGDFGVNARLPFFRGGPVFFFPGLRLGSGYALLFGQT